MPRLALLVVAFVALSACDEAVVFQGSASSPDTLVVPSTTPSTTLESTPDPSPGAFDWAGVTISDLNVWRNGDVPDEVLSTLTTACIDSVNAFTRMGQVLLDDADRVLDVGVAAEVGTASVEDASTAFDVWGNTALVVGYMAIHAVDNSSFPPEAVAFIDELGEAARIAGSSSFAISYQAFVAASGEINQTELGVWRGGLNDGLDGLLAATDSVEGEGLCR